ncbi:hypothetical protein CANTEDRAFT_115880 [Yamadazyma tenuis ATCC 10573]|uniref:ditrans,polycis-polyprenyl diphosphate synthase [(2E,6E)-farnesyldiphosphate specific] n=1 Tax=Candida tenuis (strain ATCC 10573 / BCRC 21748 / CBS 615 / JCM 9827 / NBRC 10315 / NRRL Y-1498 / VKM Y-70) TaxID=590646 RepID=G3B8S4_CANTC|nr:uncharacterized protein CANTEDRAFT_115880 [Yamadazyma tenuis ATCC 10573]EGV62913.1 hypothetical protein CANTEDRAFT_115880 [Yamadazyma tenuis ATCC 10573]
MSIGNTDETVATDAIVPDSITATALPANGDGLVSRKPTARVQVVKPLEVSTDTAQKHPPNSLRNTGIVSVFFWLVDELRRKSTGSTSTINLFITYFNHAILLIIFFIISIYKNYLYVRRRIHLKFLNLTYFPNKSPHIIRDDVNKLSRIPKRVSCIVNFKDEEEENGGIDGLINDISELTAWSVSAGIQELSIYEYNGVINDYYLELNRYINKNLKNYFGTEYVPNISIKSPHSSKVLVNKPEKPIDLYVNLLSKVDGKPTIVELTKTISELAINRELSVKDITIDLINDELVELVGSEPDLMIIFNPNLDLQDYPPWHIRLTELYWEPDNKDITYAVFIRALQNYAKAKVNVGK